MPHKEKVTFPEGTGGLAESCAIPAGVDQARPATIAAEEKNRMSLNFMIGLFRILGELTVNDPEERLRSPLDLIGKAGLEYGKGETGRIIGLLPLSMSSRDRSPPVCPEPHLLISCSNPWRLRLTFGEKDTPWGVYLYTTCYLR